MQDSKFLNKAINWLSITLIVTIALFFYELPFSLDFFKKHNILKNEVANLEKEIKSSYYYSFKIKERDFWSNLKGTEIVRTDFDSSFVEESLDILETKESPRVCSGEMNLTQEEVEYLNKYRAEIESKRLVEIELKKITLPGKFLIVGDSMMVENLGISLENHLKTLDGLEVVREAQYSTGLNKRDYFDWQNKTNSLIQDNKPEAVVAIFGANDGQPIQTLDGQKVYDLFTPEWEKAYRQRVFDYFSMINKQVKKFYFIGQPNSINSDFAQKFKIMNQIFKEEADKFENVIFVDTWERFSNNGKALSLIKNDQGKPGYAKFSDGVHLTDHGSDIVSQLVLDLVKKDIK